MRNHLWQYTTIILLTFSSQLCAQVVSDPYTSSVGPAYGYTAQGSRATFQSVAGKPDTLYYAFGGGIGQPEDDGYASLALPFNFGFFGNIIPAGNPIFASANGFLVFGTSSTTVVPTNMNKDPVSFGNQPAISPFFMDLVARGQQPGGPGLYVQTVGAEGNRVMTIEWSSMQHFNSNLPNNLACFQVRLFESDNRIVFNYDTTLFGTDADRGAQATVGIRDTTFSDPPTNVLQWGYHAGSPGGEGIMLGDTNFQISFSFAAVPEPTSIALVSAGLAGVAGTWWYRRRKERRTNRFSRK